MLGFALRGSLADALPRPRSQSYDDALQDSKRSFPPGGPRYLDRKSRDLPGRRGAVEPSFQQVLAHDDRRELDARRLRDIQDNGEGNRRSEAACREELQIRSIRSNASFVLPEKSHGRFCRRY